MSATFWGSRFFLEDAPSPPPQPATTRLATESDDADVRCREWMERALRAEKRANDSEEEAQDLRGKVRDLEEARGELLELVELLRPPGDQCMTCGREMSEYGDGDDRNCGGDCWGCIREVEEEMA